MRTIQAWFETFPEPIKTMALKNMNVPKPGGKYPTNANSLFAGFKWEETQEGAEFWSTIVSGLINKRGWKRIFTKLDNKFPEIMSKYKEMTP